MSEISSESTWAELANATGKLVLSAGKLAMLEAEQLAKRALKEAQDMKVAIDEEIRIKSGKPPIGLKLLPLSPRDAKIFKSNVTKNLTKQLK
jgi:hypothetical protein